MRESIKVAIKTKDISDTLSVHMHSHKRVGKVYIFTGIESQGKQHIFFVSHFNSFVREQRLQRLGNDFSWMSIERFKDPNDFCYRNFVHNQSKCALVCSQEQSTCRFCHLRRLTREKSQDDVRVDKSTLCHVSGSLTCLMRVCRTASRSASCPGNGRDAGKAAYNEERGRRWRGTRTTRSPSTRKRTRSWGCSPSASRTAFGMVTCPLAVTVAIS